LAIRETKSRLKKYHEFYALLEGITEVEFLQDVLIQVQEISPTQSNPSHVQSTFKLLISGFNKKFPKRESEETTAKDI